MEVGMMKFVLVGIGEILWDILPLGRQLGGAPANFAYHAHSLGEEGIVISSVGDDELGKEIHSTLKTLELVLDFITIDETHPTGTVSVMVDWSYPVLVDSLGLTDQAARAYSISYLTGDI